MEIKKKKLEQALAAKDLRKRNKIFERKTTQSLQKKMYILNALYS